MVEIINAPSEAWIYWTVKQLHCHDRCAELLRCAEGSRLETDHSFGRAAEPTLCHQPHSNEEVEMAVHIELRVRYLDCYRDVSLKLLP
jgi:hypothetical protein